MGVGSKPLHMAAGGGNVSNTRALVELGARLEATAADGSTPLHCAASEGRSETIRVLVALGAQLEATAAEHHGETPLRSAVNAKQRRRRRRWWRWVRTWARRTATA